MSSDKIYLSKEEQIFLMEVLEVNSAQEAAEAFALIMVEERADPIDLQIFIKKIMPRYEKEVAKRKKE